MDSPPLPSSERTIFLKALECASPEDRDAYLDAACGEDEALRMEVESLLRAHGTSDDLLSQVDGQDTTVFEQPSNWVGRQIGPYVIREQIGEGGMGVVYAAEQKEPVRRKVALKLIKPGMDSRQVIARFEAERQALALMDHPGVARVHDAGTTESGLPYFVMELVKGLPITKYCDRYRLSTLQRLELFTQVCRAVQHAHLKGIIHRDIKPGNILVTQIDGDPVPKVIDFGVAKAVNQQLTDKTIYTHLVQVLGTPLYISPEQAELSGVDVDTRTDVYSLGVLLYELLSGCTPFDREVIAKAGLDEMRRMIREDEPPRPSLRLSTLNAENRSTISESRQTEPAKLSQTLRGELDWIVMKSMDKDRNRRYESASQLANDVQRFIADEPVQACPPSTAYQLRKFVKKRKASFITAAVLMCVILIASVVSIWQMSEAIRARRTAELHQRRSDANYQKALQAVEQMLSHVGAVQLNGVPKMLPVQKQLLDDAVQFYEELIVENPSDLGLRIHASDTYLSLARVNKRLGGFDDKSRDRMYRRSIELVEEGLEIDRDHHASRETLVNCYWAYSIIVPTDKESIDLLKRALQQADRLPSDSNAYASLVSKACASLGIRLSSVKPEEAEQLFQRAIKAGRDANDKRLEGHANRELGIHFLNKNNLDRASECFVRAVGLYEESIPIADDAFKPTRQYELIEVRRDLADVSLQLGRESEAEEQLKSAWKTAFRLRDQNPKDVIFHRRLDAVQTQYFDLLVGLGRTSDAISILRESIKKSDQPAFDTHVQLAKLLRQSDNTSSAVIELTKAIDLKPDDTSLLLLRGQWFFEEDDLDSAQSDVDKVIQLDPENHQALNFRGKILASNRQYAGSIEDFSRAIQIAPRIYYFKRRAEVYLELGDFSRALADSEQAIKRNEKSAASWVLRGASHVGMGDYERALADYSQAINLEPKWTSFKRRSVVHFRLYDFDIAIGDLERAIELDPSDPSNLFWIPPQQVATCDNPIFQKEMVRLANKAVKLSNNSVYVLAARAFLLTHLGNPEDATRDVEKICSAIDQGESMESGWINNLAWRLAQATQANMETAKVAVLLGELAVQIDQTSGINWNTLGLAHYRAGEYSQARNAIEQSIELLNDESFAFNGFILAMVDWQMEQPETARDWLEKSTQWMEGNDPDNEALIAFREEAESLLAGERNRGAAKTVSPSE